MYQNKFDIICRYNNIILFSIKLNSTDVCVCLSECEEMHFKRVGKRKLGTQRGREKYEGKRIKLGDEPQKKGERLRFMGEHINSYSESLREPGKKGR